MDRALATTSPPSPARRLLRLACGTTLFVVAGLLGRATIIDGNTMGLIWPAGGVAALWIGSGDRRTWRWDGAALAVATYGLNVATGASAAAAVAFTVSNVVQVVVFVALCRRWLDVWGLGGAEPLHRLADLGRLVAAALVAALAAALSGAAGLGLAGHAVDAATTAVWVGRNGVGLVVITVLGLVTGPPLMAARSPGDVVRVLYEAAHARTVGRLVEAELLLASSVVLYALLFGHRDGASLSFLVLAVSVWAGLRFTPIAVMVHGIALGAVGIAYTLDGRGPFAAIESMHTRALVAQVFVAATLLTGLALSLSRVERDEANRRLARARRDADDRARLLEAVLESLGEGVVVIEEGGRILVTNNATRDLLGLDELRDQLRPAHEYGLYHDDGTPIADHELPSLLALHGDEVPPRDFHLRSESVPAGRVLEISARPVPPLDADDRPRGMVNIRDVTIDRQHRDALASFAGVVAHDLFNPLTVVRGWAETLEDEFAAGPVPAGVGLPMVSRLHEAADHMRDTIGDLLAYTVARDQSLRPTDVDLTEELRSLALLRIDGPGNPLVTVAPGLRVWADPGLARQLFDNLIGNAVKYVAPGVRPRVDIRGEREGDWLVVRVTDNGIGIPEEERELVFETFHRAHAKGYQGTGLGLAICRRIADRHGGSIHADAGPDGQGTTMVVRLPATPAVFSAEPSPAPTHRLPQAG